MEEYKKTIQKILEVIIISFVSFGLISNLESMIHIRKKYSYDFESAVEISSIRTTIEDLKLDLEQMKNKQNSHLTEEQLNKFEEYLSNTIDDIEKFSFIIENKIKKEKPHLRPWAETLALAHFPLVFLPAAHLRTWSAPHACTYSH